MLLNLLNGSRFVARDLLVDSVIDDEHFISVQGRNGFVLRLYEIFKGKPLVARNIPEIHVRIERTCEILDRLD